MSESVSKSRSPVERSYSSASSTTSSRRSGRRKRRRMKHTVMPLKKRAGRREVQCDVHRVSNLDHEEMEQSACFWVAKSIDDPAERKFKEDVFVNKDQDSSDDEMSYAEETRQSITSGEYQHDSRSETHELRTESHLDTKNIQEEKQFEVDEKENNARYANENKTTDANYFEEKTFYGVRKSKIADGNDVERVSSLPSPRNRSRISSFSDDGQSGFSSEGTGMHVGWTSDVGVSSGPEYSGMTDDSDGEGGHKRTRSGSKEFYGYRKNGHKSEFPARKIREKNNNEGGVVVATDITATKTTEVENFKDNYERKEYFEEKTREITEIDREYYTKEEIERSRSSDFSGRDVTPDINLREEYESRVSDPSQHEPSEQVNGDDYDLPINAQGEYVPRVSDPSYADPSEQFPHGATRHDAKTSAPTGNVHPSSDTELVNFRSFDIEVERYSDRSLPLGGHKTKTQYYSVEDLIRATQEEEKVENVPGSGSDDGPEIPRVGEYENYEPPQETREDDPKTRAPQPDDQQVQPDENDKPTVVPGSYEVRTQRPLLVPRRDKDTDERDKDDLSTQDEKPVVERSGTYEESKDFYGYRRTTVDENGSEIKENLKQQYNKEMDSGRPTNEKRDGYTSPGTSQEFGNQDQDREIPKDNRGLSDDDPQFEESKEFYGYRQSRTGAEPHDVRQRHGKNKSSDDQSNNTKWQETKEFYGYRTSRTGSKENLLNDNEQDNSGPQKWQQNQEYYGYRQSKTGDEFARPKDEMKQTKSNAKKTKTFKESREFYGFRSFGSSENISKGGRNGQVWEESKEFFDFRRKVVDGQTHFAEHHDRPRSPLLRRIEGKPLYLESADDKRRQEKLKESRDQNTTDVSGKKNLSDDKQHYEKQSPYDTRPPYDKSPPLEKRSPHEKQRIYEERPPYEKPPPSGKIPGERITKSQGQDNLTSVDDGRELANKLEESREFYGYRPPEQLPRSAAYEQYVPPSERTTIRGYEKSTRYTERQPRETNVTEHKSQTSEPEISYSRTDDVYTKPEDVPGEPTEKYEPATRYFPTRGDDSSDTPRDRHMFNTLEIPSSKKVIPVVCDIAPKVETNETITTETAMTKRLHTRSQRDTLRREARQSKTTEPDTSDVGMKMFRQRSLPRKHSLPTSPEEKSKELPCKITKKSDEPELSQVDPEYASRFQKTTEKRQQKANTTTKTTEKTTKGAAESCNKNVEELVNVFNTLEHIQKTTEKKTDRTVQPRQVRKIVKGESLDESAEKQNNLSPASSVSQKLDEIEDILNSVDKNRRRATQNKPDVKYKAKQTRDETDTSSLTRKTREMNTTRETREERETREAQEKHKWKPRTPDEHVTKQEEMPVESFLDDAPMRGEPDRCGKPSLKEPFGRFRPTRDRPRAYAGRSPYRTDKHPRGHDTTRSRDDDDEIYRAQMRKSREESWKDTRKSRKKKYGSKSDGEIEGFRTTPFGDRVITPGTPVNIRLYGLNLQKSKENRPQDLNWEVFSREVPVDENVGRTQLKKQPFEVEQIPGTKIPVDESVDRTAVKVQPLDVEQMPGEKPRIEEPTINRSHVRPTDVNNPPFLDQNDKPQTMKDLHQQEQLLYRRQERLPRKRDAPVEKSDSLDDGKVASQMITWSHPPISKVRPEKQSLKKAPESPSEQLPKDKEHQEELPFKEYPSKENMLQERPSETYPWSERPYKEQPYDQQPYKRSPGDIEIPVEKIQETDEPDRHVIEIEYKDDDDDENMPVGQDHEPGKNTLYEKSTQRSTTPKLRSPRKSDDVLDDSFHTTHEESTERHESTSHESSKGVDTTIHTTRTTRTTRTETTETTVKKIRKSGSEFYRPNSQSTNASGEPDFRVPVKSEPDVFTEPDYTGPEQMAPSSSLTPDAEDGEPQTKDEPSLVATEFIVLNNDTRRPINVTMLGRLEENDDDDYLSSQSREDLFLHTRLKMVTENKNRTTRKPEDPQLLEGKPADEDDLDNEGSLTSSDDEFDNEDVSVQILIPISGEIKEKVRKQDWQRYVLPKDDVFTPQIQIDESVVKTNQPTREDIVRGSLGSMFTPRIPHEPDLEREHAPTKAMPDFKTIRAFEEPVSENIQSSEKPGVILEFGEPVEDVQKIDDIEIVEIPIFDDFSVESAPESDSAMPLDKPPINERVSTERTATPTVPELKHEPVDENITFEKQVKNLNMPDIPVVKPVKPVDESIPPSTQTARGVYIPELEDVLPEIRRPPTPTLVNETITQEQRKTDIELPHFMAARPSQPIDEGVIQSEPIKKQVYVPDFAELIPEPKKPVLPVDENVTAERRDSQREIPQFQVAEPERRSSEPIKEEVSANETLKSGGFIPDFAREFQEVVPEYHESGIINEDRDIPVIVQKEEKTCESLNYQEAEQEPHWNFRITESDLEVEAPSSGAQSTDSGVSEKIDLDNYDPGSPEKIPKKVPSEKDIYEKDSYEKNTEEDETWSETRKTVKETRTTETVTVEETITKYISESSQKEKPVSPQIPRKERPVAAKAVHFPGSIEQRESSESSSEPSPRSSFGASAEGPTRKRRSRRGNRFDNLKRSGSLVPESVVRDESPESTGQRFYIAPSNVPRVASPVVAEQEQPISNAPDSRTFFAPREKPGQLRPEMYLLDSDDEMPGADPTKPDEEPEEVKFLEGVMGEDEIPARDELSPQLIDELLEKEIQGLAEDDKSLGTSEEEPEVEDIISKEKQRQPQLESMPKETSEIHENVLTEEALDKDDDSPAEVMEEIEKKLNEAKPDFSEEEDGKFPQEEIEKAIDKKEESSTCEEEPEEIDESVSKSFDERIPVEIMMSEPTREDTLQTEVPDKVPVKSGPVYLADFEVTEIERLNVVDTASDKDDGSEKSVNVSESADNVNDIIPKDDNDVCDKVDDFPGGITTEEESTVETVTVEKTHSEVTVTEITTTTRYPSSPHETSSKTSEIPEEPKESSSDAEDHYVIIPTNLEKDEIIKPCQVETFEGIPTEQQAISDDESIPYLVITEERIPLPTARPIPSDSDSDSSSSEPKWSSESKSSSESNWSSESKSSSEPKSSSKSKSFFDSELFFDSESSTKGSSEERTDGDRMNFVFSAGTMAEEPNQPTETVFGILDINYEKLKTEDIVMVEKTAESPVEVNEPSTKTLTDEELLIVELPEKVATYGEVSAEDAVPAAPEELKENTNLLELDIDVVPEDEGSTSSSDQDRDKRESTETSETTVETLIIEKTSTQISTTITKITESDDSEDFRSDTEVPITIVPEDEPKLQAPSEAAASQPDDRQSTTFSDSEATTDKDDKPDDEITDINVLVVSDDEKSATSSDQESASDDEKRQEPSTVETIIVEKTHVSTSITEITTNAANYPADDVLDDTPILVKEAAPSFEECPITDDFPIAEDVPRTENTTYETAPPKYEGLVYEISPGEKIQDTDGHVPNTHDIIKIPTSERESQTEDRDVRSETTQTDDTTKTTRAVTKDAHSMTPTRLSSDLEIQTQVQQGSSSTQTNYDEDSEWYKYTRTLEEYRETSKKVTNRQLSDGETQTDIPVDDLRVLATTHEGTQTEMEDCVDESEVTRITRKTTTETRSETSYTEETDQRSSGEDIKNDCPVCLQSLEGTNYSFIKVKDLSRFVKMEEKHTQHEETNETNHSVWFASGREDEGGYSDTMRDEQGERSTMDGEGDAIRELRNRSRRRRDMDMTDGHSKTRSDAGYEKSRSGEGSGHSSTSMYERGHDEVTRESEEYSSTKREDWSYEQTTRETSEYVSTASHEWERDVVVQSESSTEVPEGAHFTLRIDGDEKCLLYCRRSGQHACALQKLASIVEAHRRETTSRSQPGGSQAQPEKDGNTETIGLERASEDGDSETGTSDVTGPQRCDVSVQTDGTLLPADFEVFSDKDFEIYYDEQKSPWFV